MCAKEPWSIGWRAETLIKENGEEEFEIRSGARDSSSYRCELSEDIIWLCIGRSAASSGEFGQRRLFGICDATAEE